MYPGEITPGRDGIVSGPVNDTPELEECPYLFGRRAKSAGSPSMPTSGWSHSVETRGNSFKHSFSLERLNGTQRRCWTTFKREIITERHRKFRFNRIVGKTESPPH